MANESVTVTQTLDQVTVVSEGPVGLNAGGTISGALNVGVDGTGHDVKFFGDTAGKYMQWDQSADKLFINGELEVNGSATTFNSTVITIDDPVFTLGGQEGSPLTGNDSAGNPNDSKDRGIEFFYNDGAAKRGFMGYDDSADAFTFLTSATNSNEIFSGTAATLLAGNVTVGAGSAGSPSLTFSSDTDTGLFNRTAGELNVAIGGSWIANFQSTGLKIYAGTGIFNRNGSAAAPSFTFGDDTDTGMYRKGADALGFSTGGTERVSIDSSGNVSVDGQITAAGDVVISASNSRFEVIDTDSSLKTVLAAGDSLGTVGTYTNHPFHIRTNTQSAIVVDTSQRVGIGTAAPAALLDIAGDAVFSEGASGNEITIGYNTSPPSGGSGLGLWAIGSGKMWLKGYSSLHLGYNKDLTVADSGNVGIGTTAPTTLLECYESGNETPLIVRSNLTTFTGIGFRESSASGANMGFVGIKRTDSPSSSDSEIHLQNSKSGTVSTSLMVDTSGNVGIGVAAPTSILHVEGATPTVTVKGTGTASSKVDLINGSVTWSLENQYVGGATTNMFRIYNSSLSADALTINRATNNIGIGTTAPSELLHLSSATSHKPVLLVENTNADSSGAFLRLFKNTASAGVDDNIGAIQFQSNNNQGSGRVFAQIAARIHDPVAATATGELKFNTFVNGTDTTVMTMLDGSVGIGTTAPQSPLHVAQVADSNGIRVYGYDNQNTHYVQLAADHQGDGIFRSSSGKDVKVDGDVNTEIGTVISDAVIIGRDSGDRPITLQNNGVVMKFTGGNVGIGTTAPSQKLTVEGNIELGTGGYIYGDTTTPYLRLSNAAGAVLGYLNAYISLGETFVYNSGGTERFRIVSSTGNVGIGENSPATALSVKRDSGSVISEVAHFVGGGSTDDKTQITVGGNTSSALVSFGFRNTGSGFGYIANASDAEVLTIDGGNSRVGIGTTAPAHTLEVAGDIGINESLRHNGDTDTFLTFSDNVVGIYAGNEYAVEVDATSTTFNQNGIDRDFRVEGDNDQYAIFVKGSNDYVGIGNSNPIYKLDITGNIRFSSSSVANGDLTFNDNKKANFGNATDLRIYHDGSNSHVYNASGGGDLRLSSGGNESIRLESGGLVRVFGNLQVDGTTTTVNSTTVTVDDPVLTLGGDTAPSSDDNKDRGIEFRYYDGSAKVGFMGWDDSVGGFTFLKAATNSSEVFSGTAASLVTGAISTSGNLSITGDKSILNQGDAAKGSIRFYDQSGGIIMLNGGTTNALRFDSHVKFLAEKSIQDGDGNTIFNFYTSAYDGVSAPILRFASTMALEGANAPSFLSRDNIVLRIDSNNDSTSNYFSVEADAGTELFRIKETGNVGIANNNPAQKLSVTGSAAISSTLYLGSESATGTRIQANSGVIQGYYTTGADARFHLGRDAFAGGYAGLIMGGSGGYSGIGATTTGNDLLFSTNMASAAGGIATERMRITSAGNVAIGQTTAGYKLDVDGDIRIKDAHNLLLGDGADFQIQHNGSDTFITNLTGDVIFAQSADNGDILFQSDNGSGGITNYLQIDGGNERTNIHKDLQFTDNVKSKFGTSGDLEIFHDGTNSYIENKSAGGDLYIKNTADDKDIRFQSDDGSGGLAEYFRLDGTAAHCYFSKSVIFEDNIELKIGTGNDLNLFSNGSNTTIRNQNQGDLFIQNTVDDQDIIFQSDDGSGGLATYLTIDGSTETTKFYKGTKHLDSVVGAYGDSSDLLISHTGSLSRIQNSTGHFEIINSADDQDIIFQCDDGSGGLATYMTIDGGREEVVASKPLIQNPGTVDPANNGELAFTVVSNTAIKIKYKGTDGVVRSTSLTLS